MSGSKLKVGDFVRAYGYDSGGYLLDGQKAEIIDFTTLSRYAKIKIDHLVNTNLVHTKQLRKLQPKNPRREIWFNEWLVDGVPRLGTTYYNDPTEARITRADDFIRTVHFREVRKK